MRRLSRREKRVLWPRDERGKPSRGLTFQAYLEVRQVWALLDKGPSFKELTLRIVRDELVYGEYREDRSSV